MVRNKGTALEVFEDFENQEFLNFKIISNFENLTTIITIILNVLQTVLTVLNVAKNVRKDVNFAVADDEEFAEIMKKFNLQDSGEDVNVGCKGKDASTTVPEDEMDEDVLSEFVNDFIAGKAKAFIKSKPVPKKQGPVIEVVGKTFNDIVMDNDKVTWLKIHFLFSYFK